jgi:hypothetical protein
MSRRLTYSARLKVTDSGVRSVAANRFWCGRLGALASGLGAYLADSAHSWSQETSEMTNQHSDDLLDEPLLSPANSNHTSRI